MRLAVPLFFLFCFSFFGSAQAQDLSLTLDPPAPLVGDDVTFTLEGGPEHAGQMAGLFFGENEPPERLFALGIADAQGIFRFSYQNLPPGLAGRVLQSIGYMQDPQQGIDASNLLSWSVSTGEILPVITPNRISGVAPLAVFFDAIESEGLAGEDYVEASFSWDFDVHSQDPGNPWSRKEGFVTAHVFEKPGTYTIEVRATDKAGQIGTAQTTITVEDAEVAFLEPRGRTICVSASGDFSQCPSSDPADHVISQDLPEIFALLDTNVRVLLRRGEKWSFNSTEYIRDVQGPAHLGAFPYPYEDFDPVTGDRLEKPRIKCHRNDPGVYSLRQKKCHDLRISRIEFEGNHFPGSSSGAKGWHSHKGSQILFDRLDMYHWVNAFNVDESDSGRDATIGVYFTNNDLEVIEDYGLFGAGYQLATINNSMRRFTGNEHGIRIAGGDRSFHYRNHIMDTPQEKTAIAIRGQGDVGANRNVAVIGNHVDNTIQAAPSNDKVNHAISRLLVENNVVVKLSGPFDGGMRFEGRDYVARGNLIYNFEKAIAAKNHPKAPDSDNIRIQNNTVIWPRSTGYSGVFLEIGSRNQRMQATGNISLYLGRDSGNDFLRSDAPASEIESDHNLIFAPFLDNWKPFDVGGSDFNLGQWQDRHGMDGETLQVDPRFLSVDPEDVFFAVPDGASPAIDSGIWLPLFQDILGNLRPVGPHDRGAIEVQ